MAITYGMSVKEFWEDSPDLFWAYRFSYFTKLKTDQDLFNNNAWLQGAYFYEALVVALANSFGKQKVEYSKKPYEMAEEKNNVKQETLVARIKNRVSQVQTLMGEKEIDDKV